MTDAYEKFRDPELFKRHYFATRADRPLVLGLDFGTTCGYCFSYLPAPDFDPNTLDMYMGVLDLSSGSYDSGALRLVRLRQFLMIAQPAMIFYEDVKYTPPGMGGMSPQAIIARAATSMEFLGSLRGVVAEFSESHNIPSTGVPIGVIKKRATGKGNANKQMMVEALNAHFSIAVDPESEEAANVADATFALLAGLDDYGKGIPWPRSEPPEPSQPQPSPRRTARHQPAVKEKKSASS
jgi:hypothetical protein